jgi:uncharacterized protein (TIGR00266 family)
MQHEILYQPSYSLLRVQLAAGEQVTAESGAMVSMSDGVQIETKGKGGFFKAIKRSMLGDIVPLQLAGQTVFAQGGAYLASSPALEVDTKWGGAKTFFSKEGFFLLKISGAGDLFLTSYGAIYPLQLAAGQSYIVDTGHMVAFDESVQYNVTRVGGLKSTLFSGEGLVCRLTGPGRIWVQTRSIDSYLAWLIPHLPHKG